MPSGGFRPGAGRPRSNVAKLTISAGGRTTVIDLPRELVEEIQGKSYHDAARALVRAAKNSLPMEICDECGERRTKMRLNRVPVCAKCQTRLRRKQ